MNSELLSVVDQHDQIIDTRTRHEIHQTGLRHRAVHILLFNEQNQLFLQKRSMQKDQNPGLWDTSAAGHVDVGEDYEVSAVRETLEELGVDISHNLQRLYKLKASPKLGMEFIQVFRAFHNGPFKLNQEEIDEGQWFQTQTIDQRVHNNDNSLTPTFKTIWQHYIKLCKEKV